MTNLSNNVGTKLDEIINKNGCKQSSIIPILQDIQNELNYLPEDALEYVSKAMNISPSKIFSVATFYENFSLVPKGKNIIKICDGTACHVKKSIPILEALKKELNLDNQKRTTDDFLFTVETVSCLGACGLAPVITVNGKVYGKITPESVAEIIRNIRNNTDIKTSEGMKQDDKNKN